MFLQKSKEALKKDYEIKFQQQNNKISELIQTNQNNQSVIELKTKENQKLNFAVMDLKDQVLSVKQNKI